MDTSQFPDSTYLGVLGMTGLTAYTGLVHVAEMQEGDAVFISGAAGAVGSVAGQIARLLGASRVVGSAGTPEKVARVKELGFDAAFDYHDGSPTDLLAEAAPDRYVVVPGELLDAGAGEELVSPVVRRRLAGLVATRYPAVTPRPDPPGGSGADAASTAPGERAGRSVG